MQLTREDDKGIYAASVAAIKLDGPVAAREAKAKAAATGISAAAAGDSYLGDGNYAKAAELYKVALAKGVTKVDEVNTRLGIAYALQRDDANARAAFAQVKSSPRNQIAAFWIVWLDLGATVPTS
jgi:lipopolysaccharide biosynthesis regulator YciM